MTRLFIAAPTPLMRAGLRALLTLDNSELQVIGEAATLDEQPDLSGVDAVIVANEELLTDTVVRNLTENRKLAVVLLSSDERAVGILRLMRLRGWAIVPAEAPASELQAAVTAAVQGLLVLPARLLDQILGQRLPSMVETLNFGTDTLDDPLTGREQEVLELLSQGQSNKMIARKLQISEHTVKFHVSSLYTKLGTSNRAEAVSRAARLGLITF